MAETRLSVPEIKHILHFHFLCLQKITFLRTYFDLVLLCDFFAFFVTFPCGVLYLFVIVAFLLTFTTADEWNCVAAKECLPVFTIL